MLLAGTPNHLWRHPPEGRAARVATDSLFGAVIAPDGSARTVQSPIPGKLLGSIRALGRGDGTWDVVFAELFPTETFPPPDSIARLWYGVLDGTRWASVEPLPTPPGVRLHSLHASPLVRSGDTLALALTALTPGFYRDVAIFERRAGRWHHEIVPTRSSGYPVVAYADSVGLLLAVVRADSRWNNPDSARGGFDRNSLFLYARHPAWHILRRVAHGVTEPVDHPSLIRSGDNLVLSWAVETETGSEARAVINVLNGPPDLTVVLDPAFAGHPPVRSLVLSDGHHLWITRHSPAGASSSQLRFARTYGHGATLIGNLPNHFLGGFGAAPGRDSDVLLTGAESAHVDQGHPTVGSPASLLVRVRVVCSPAATRDEGSSRPPKEGLQVPPDQEGEP